jgi:Fic family protein
VRLSAGSFFGIYTKRDLTKITVSDTIKTMEYDINSCINPSLLRSIEGKKRELDSFRPLSPEIVRKLYDQFSLEWTYNSNAIEGNTLTLQETILVINQGITIGNKTLREHFEAINHQESIGFLYDWIQKKEELTESVLLQLHKIILKNINDSEAGHYRRSNVMILGSRHIPPQAVKVPALMAQFFEWYYANEHILPVAELAAWAHYKLVYIHPFIDGNGRTARLLMNLILMQRGYPPAVILRLDRKKYMDALNEANRGNYTDFLNFIGRSVERSLLIYLNALKSKDDKNDNYGYMSLQEAAKVCGKSQEYLSWLSRTGKLSAVKIVRNWKTTREAIMEYSKGKEK